MSSIKQNRTAFYCSTAVHWVTLATVALALYYPRDVNPDVVVGLSVVNFIFATYWLATVYRSNKSPRRHVQVGEAVLRMLASLAFIEYNKRGRTRFRLSRNSLEYGVLILLVLSVPLSASVYTGFVYSTPQKPVELKPPPQAARPEPMKSVHFQPRSFAVPKSPVSTLFPQFSLPSPKKVVSWKGILSAKKDSHSGVEQEVDDVQVENYKRIVQVLHDPGVCQTCKYNQISHIH